MTSKRRMIEDALKGADQDLNKRHVLPLDETLRGLNEEDVNLFKSAAVQGHEDQSRPKLPADYEPVQLSMIQAIHQLEEFVDTLVLAHPWRADKFKRELKWIVSQANKRDMGWR